MASRAFFVWVKGGNCFDKTDGSDGQKIFCIVLQMLIIFYDMSDQTEIALDQNMTGLIVTVCTASQKLGFLFWSKRRRKGFQYDYLKIELLTLYVKVKCSVLFHSGYFALVVRLKMRYNER
mgnify:FL=1